MISDPHGFLEGVTQGCNHRPLLLLALEATKGSPHPVAELGMGYGSTRYLHDYCVANDRDLLSVDSSAPFCELFGILRCPHHRIQCVGQDWDSLELAKRPWSVALVDHGDAAHRHVEARNLKDSCAIVVIHDTEPEATGYLLDRIWPLFKWRVDIRNDGGAWASAVSNFINLDPWRGMAFGDWRVS